MMRSTARRAAGRFAHAATSAVSRVRYAIERRSDVAILESALQGEDARSYAERFREQSPGCFFADNVTAADCAHALAAQVATWREQTVSDADQILAGVVRLLGRDSVDVRRGADEPASALRWHEDVFAGYRWSAGRFYRQIEIPEDRADIKVPWELSRCQHLPTLGMAYVASGNERYAEAAVAQILDWIECNPVGYGVNWACAMEVAIRAVNWLWTIHLVRASRTLASEALVRLLASLHVHGRHISQNIEIYAGGLTTNHTLADYVGLLYLGLALPRSPDSQRWLVLGRDGLERCMELQVHADGVDFENSIPYHRLVLEMLLGSHLLAERTGCPFSEGFRARLERMLEFVNQYTRPDGLAPIVGDSDDGRLQILSRYFDWDPRDHRYLLAKGGIAFGRADFVQTAAGSPDALAEATWLLGPRACDALRDLAPTPAANRESCAFPQGGRYVMRTRNLHALICADPVGTAGLGNHKHNDILSYELSLGGVPIVVDCGSFAYTGDRAWRDRFRSTASHSTVAVEHAEQNEFAGPFAMRADADVVVSSWRSNGQYDYMDATHSGFERLDAAVTHRRRFLLIKQLGVMLVLDSLRGRGDFLAESFVHLAPGGAVADGPAALSSASFEAMRKVIATENLFPESLPPVDLDRAVRYQRDGTEATFVPLGPASVSRVDGWYSPRYGQRVRAPVLRFSLTIHGSGEFGYLISP